MLNPPPDHSSSPGIKSLAAMRAIERYRRPLLVAGVAFLVLLAAEVIYLRGHGTFDGGGRLRALALVLPPLGALLCLLPLCYLSWLRPPQPRRLRRIKLALFWLFALAALLGWCNVLWLSLKL